MSNQKHIIEVEPPLFRQRLERKEFHGYVCPSCNGGGGFYDEQDHHTACHRCEGTGRLMAIVTIEWSADL